MADLTLRLVKGSPLTNAEVDANFTNLNAELGQKLVASSLTPYLTSATAASTYQTILTSGSSIKTVNGQSVLGSGNIQIDGGVTSFNTRTGAVSLSSGDVTTALGFTPYNSTNPSGYTSNVGTVTSVGITAGTGVTVSNSPITTSGNITVGLSTKLTAIENLSGAGFFTQNGSGAIAGRTLQAGTGISIAHGNGSSQDPVITNSAPDQTVALTGAGATSISGTYPNFTITSVNTTYGAATSTVPGLIELGSSTQQTVAANAVTATASRTYALQVNADGQGVINVPWTSSGGTVTSVNGTGTVSGLTLTGTVTDSGSLTLGGTLSLTSGQVTTALGYTPYNNTNPSGYTSNVGTVTGVTAGTGLTGGTVTSSGTISLATSGVTAGTYTKLTVDVYGRATLGALLSSGDVTTALGFTPYNSTNPSGYIASSGSYADPAWITSLASSKLTGTIDNARLNGGTYTINITGNAATVGASTSAGIQSTFVASINTTTPGTGNYGVLLTNSGGAADSAHGITWAWASFGSQAGIYVQSSGAYGTKMYLATTDSFAAGAKTAVSIDHLGNVNIARGALTQGGNQALHAGNYTSYSPSLTGSGASGTWGISVTGNAATATALQTARTIGGVSFNGTANINLPGVNVAGNQNTSGTAAIATAATVTTSATASAFKVPFANTTASTTGNYGLLQDSEATFTYNPSTNTLVVGTVSGALSGNATTATTLQTSRTINGIPFNGSAAIDTTEWFHSNRDFPNGTLITTSINYAVSEGDPFVLEIRGNSYGGIVPLDLLYQGYIYSGTIINHGGISNGLNISGLVAINNGGNLCFWFPSQGYWNGYNVKVYSAYATRATNRVTSITGVAKPTTAKEVALSANIRQSLHSGNYTSYAPSLTGSGASGTWGISITGRSNSVIYFPNRTDGTAYPILWGSAYTDGSGTQAYSCAAVTLRSSDGTIFSTSLRGSGNVAGTGQATHHPAGIYSTGTNWLYGQIITNGNTVNAGGATCNLTATRANRANGFFYIDDNYGCGIVGAYASTRYQGVFAMGDSYKLPADGTSTGSLYGMAWSHPNAGGAAGNLTDHGLLIINNGGFRCAISNSIVASANITAFSDERLKTNWRDMPENFVARLAQVKVGIYDRTDEEDITQVGVSAQSFQKLLPQAIMTAKDKMNTLSVNYGGAALASAVELAKDNVDLRARIEKLEALVLKLIEE